jgi:hypothetical protein
MNRLGACKYCDNEGCLGCDSDDVLGEALYLPVFGYNSAVSDNIFNILEYLCIGNREDRFVTGLAKRFDLTPEHVELIQYLLCGADLCDYGTSPRGCFITDKGRELYSKLKTLREEEEDK